MSCGFPVQGQTVTTSKVDPWLPALTVMILNGCEPRTVTPNDANSIGCDELGHIVLHRQLTNRDRECIPELRDASEIWITFDFPIECE